MFHLEAERLGAKCVPMRMQWPSQISLMCSAPLKTLYSCGKPQMRSSLWAVSQPNLFPNPAKLQCSSSSENYKNYNVAQVQKRIWCNLGCFAECSRIHGGCWKNIECNIFLASSWIIFCVQRVCVYEVDRKCTRYIWHMARMLKARQVRLRNGSYYLFPNPASIYADASISGNLWLKK